MTMTMQIPRHILSQGYDEDLLRRVKPNIGAIRSQHCACSTQNRRGVTTVMPPCLNPNGRDPFLLDAPTEVTSRFRRLDYAAFSWAAPMRFRVSVDTGKAMCGILCVPKDLRKPAPIAGQGTKGETTKGEMFSSAHKQHSTVSSDTLRSIRPTLPAFSQGRTDDREPHRLRFRTSMKVL